jgi:hypothetical protein
MRPRVFEVPERALERLPLIDERFKHADTALRDEDAQLGGSCPH